MSRLRSHVESPVRNGCCFSHGARLRKFPHGKYGSQFSRSSVLAFSTVAKRSKCPLAYQVRIIGGCGVLNTPLKRLHNSHLRIGDAECTTTDTGEAFHCPPPTCPGQKRASVRTVGLNHITPLGGLWIGEGEAEALPGWNRFPDSSGAYRSGPGLAAISGYHLPPWVTKSQTTGCSNARRVNVGINSAIAGCRGPW